MQSFKNEYYLKPSHRTAKNIKMIILIICRGSVMHFSLNSTFIIGPLQSEKN